MLAATIVAVASTVAVSLLVARVDGALVAESSALLAGDLAIASSEPPPLRYRQAAAALGLEQASTASLRSVVAAGGHLQLVQLKATDTHYPLRGRLLAADTPEAAPQSFAHGPPVGEAWAEAKLFALLGLKIGDAIGIGRSQLRLSRVLVLEPDRGDDLFSIAPRVLMTLDDLAHSALIVPGSRVAYTSLVAGPAAQIARYRTALNPALGHTVLDPRSARPELRAALSQAERFLTLAAFTGVMLAAIGIALAAAGYAELHEVTVAILKTLGLTRRAVITLLFWELFYLALAATLIGDAVALGIQQLLLMRLIPIASYAATLPAMPALAQGGAIALVALGGFGLPALARLSQLPVTAILARDRSGLPPVRAAHIALMLAALTAIAPWQSGNPRLVLLALLGMLGSALALAAVAYALVRVLATLRRRTTMSWRFGLASVARRARLSVLQTTALGLGLAVILLLGLVRNDLYSQWRNRLPPDAPNQFLINIQADERAALTHFLRTQADVDAVFYPMVRGRLLSINERAVRPDDYPDQRARRLTEREFNLSYADQLKADNRIVSGRWWQAGAASGLSVEEGLAKTLGIALGDQLEFLVADQRVRGQVTSLRHVDWDNFQVNFFVVTPPALLAGGPATFITSFRLDQRHQSVMPALVAQFPSVTVIDVDALMRQVRQVMDRVAQALTWVFMFALAAGALVLAAAVQASQRERLQDTVLLKTLGASRQFIRHAILAEFAVIGFIAGTLGSAGALATGWLVATRVLEIPYQPDWRIPLAGIVAGLCGLLLLGWRVVAQALRESVVHGLRESM